MTYNGWKNYETWNVNLWLTNDEGTYYYCMELAEEADDIYELSKQLEEFVDENNPLTSGMYADLLGGALSAVDYYEIAEHFYNDVECFAVVQNIESKIIVFGVGKTQDEAYDDSLEWITDEDDEEDLPIIKCTRAVYDYVNENGGQGNFYLDYEILRLKEEE